MIDPAEIATALSLLSNSVSIAKASLKALVKVGAAKEVTDALEKVEDVYGQLFDLQTKLLALQSENEVLRKEIEERDDWEKRKSDYKLFTTPAGSIIWEFQREPKHYACPVCMESKKEIHPLQDKTRCMSCTNHFPFDPPETVSHRLNRSAWM